MTKHILTEKRIKTDKRVPKAKTNGKRQPLTSSPADSPPTDELDGCPLPNIGSEVQRCVKGRKATTDEETVMFNCTSAKCVYAGQLIHIECMDRFEINLIKTLSVNGSARGWTKTQTRQNLWNANGLGLMAKALKCPCQKGNWTRNIEVEKEEKFNKKQAKAAAISMRENQVRKAMGNFSPNLRKNGASSCDHAHGKRDENNNSVGLREKCSDRNARNSVGSNHSQYDRRNSTVHSSADYDAYLYDRSRNASGDPGAGLSRIKLAAKPTTPAKVLPTIVTTKAAQKSPPQSRKNSQGLQKRTYASAIKKNEQDDDKKLAEKPTAKQLDDDVRPPPGRPTSRLLDVQLVVKVAGGGHVPPMGHQFADERSISSLTMTPNVDSEQYNRAAAELRLSSRSFSLSPLSRNDVWSHNESQLSEAFPLPHEFAQARLWPLQSNELVSETTTTTTAKSTPSPMKAPEAAHQATVYVPNVGRLAAWDPMTGFDFEMGEYLLGASFLPHRH